MRCLADEVIFAVAYLSTVIIACSMFCVSHDNGDSGQHAIYFIEGFEAQKQRNFKRDLMR